MRTLLLTASVLATLAVPAIAQERNGAQSPDVDGQAAAQLVPALHAPLSSTTPSVSSEHRCDWVAWMTGGCSR